MKNELLPFKVSNLLNGIGFFIITNYFLIYFTSRGYTSQDYSYIFATALLSEAFFLFMLPKLSNSVNNKTLIIVLYLVPGIGILFAIIFDNIFIILVGFVIFILAGASWPPLAVYIKRLSNNGNYSKLLNSSISVPIRIGYILASVISFTYLLFMSSLYYLLIYGSIIILASGLPFFSINRDPERLTEQKLRPRTLLSSLKYSVYGQLHYLFTPFLALLLYDYGLPLYTIGLLMVVRYVGGIFLGIIVSRLMDDKDSRYIMLSLFFLTISLLFLILNELIFTLIALFFSGIGGPSSNLFYSLFSKTNKNEISDSSSFGITSLFWSSIFILLGGIFIERGPLTLFYSSLVISIVIGIMFFIIIIPKVTLPQQCLKP